MSASPAAASLDLVDVAVRIWQRRALAVFLFAVPVFVGGAWLVTRPVVFEAKASIVLENEGEALADLKGQMKDLRIDDATVETQVKVLTSPELAGAVIKKLELGKASDKAEEKTADNAEDRSALSGYLKNLSVTPVRSSQVIEIAFRAADPVLAAQVANAHTEAYVQERITTRQKQASEINAWIEKQVETLTEQSRAKSLELEKARSESGAVIGRNEEELIYQQISDTAAQLVPLEVKRYGLQAQLDALAAPGEKAAAPAPSPLIQELKAQASAARQELKSLSAKFGKNHPSYREAQKRVSQIESDIGRENRNIQDSARKELEAVVTQEQMLKDKLDALKKQAEDLRATNITRQPVEQEQEAEKKLLDTLLSRYGEIASQIELALPNVRVLSRAEVPQEPVGRKTSLLLVAVMFMSAVFSAALTYGVSLLDTTVRSPEEIRDRLNIRFLGALPRARSPQHRENIKRIVLQLSRMPEKRVILVTSAEGEDGHSAFSLALATYLAGIGRKIALVDANRSAPHISRALGLAKAKGLSDLLAGRMALHDAMAQNTPGLAVMPVGSSAPDMDFMASGNFTDILAQLKSGYDYIFVDAAPVFSSADAEVLAALCDSVIMVIGAGRTPIKKLRAAAETLREFSPSVPCAVLGNADIDQLLNEKVNEAA